MSGADVKFHLNFWAPTKIKSVKNLCASSLSQKSDVHLFVQYLNAEGQDVL